MDLLNRYNVPQVDILKLDIEGAEREVFAHNAEQWLDKVRVIGIELHDRWVPGCSRAFYQAVCGYDFNHTIIGESVFVELLGQHSRDSARRGSS
jgi:Methyltransferase FkbM domain